MRTLLSQFCDEFGAVVHPLLDPLAKSSESLASLDPGSPIRRLLPGLRDRTHQLQSLATKVEEQQAYVLIFGPLKSGKSTLMNAIAASYVSEVTTMPAYPCMVFVQHAKQRLYKQWTATWQWRSIRLVPALERLAFDNIFDLILIDHPQKVMLAPFPYTFPFRASGNISAKKLLKFTLDLVWFGLVWFGLV